MNRQILDYVGDDGEFLYPVDENGQFDYAKATLDYPPHTDYAISPLYRDGETVTHDSAIALGYIKLVVMIILIVFVFILSMAFCGTTTP